MVQLQSLAEAIVEDGDTGTAAHRQPNTWRLSTVVAAADTNAWTACRESFSAEPADSKAFVNQHLGGTESVSVGKDPAVALELEDRLQHRKK